MTAAEFASLRPGDRIRLADGWCGVHGPAPTYEVRAVNKCGTLRLRLVEVPRGELPKRRAGRAVTPAAWERA